MNKLTQNTPDTKYQTCTTIHKLSKTGFKVITEKHNWNILFNMLLNFKDG